MAAMELVRPTPEHLPSAVDALRRGWSPDTERAEAGAEALAEIASDPQAFLAGCDDRQGAGPPILLPDGSTVRRLPGMTLWMWDGAFAGSVSIRWEPGTTDLPPTCLGHVGYSVVPWRRRRGYATDALRQALPLLREQGLAFAEVQTTPDNVASQRVIEANGGVLVEEYDLPAQHGGGRSLRYRIDLA
jgi:predicted acetyltransferase